MINDKKLVKSTTSRQNDYAHLIVWTQIANQWTFPDMSIFKVNNARNIKDHQTSMFFEEVCVKNVVGFLITIRIVR